MLPPSCTLEFKYNTQGVVEPSFREGKKLGSGVIAGVGSNGAIARMNGPCSEEVGDVEVVFEGRIK